MGARRDRSVELQLLRGRMSSPVRAERRLVRAHREVPTTLKRRRHRPGSVWAITMVRNEEDAIGPAVAHYADQGVDGLIVADNGSTDATRQILEEARADAPLHVVGDRLFEFFQATKMTMLAELARRAGADWVIPFDADELWFARGARLKPFLSDLDVDIVRATIHNVFPSHEDDVSEANPFSRLRRIDTSAHRMWKVAFRPQRLFSICKGNHDVQMRGRVGDGLFVAHFPWRTKQQVVEKVTGGVRAADAAQQSERHSRHWRAMAKWSEAEIDRNWDTLLAGESIDEMIWTPQGDLREVDVTSWTAWGLESRPPECAQ